MSRQKIARTDEQIENHKQYIKKQFLRLIKPSFRDVIFHASFIEATSKILKDKKIVLDNFLELNLREVKELRDSILHHVIHDKLTQREIEDCIGEIFRRIWPIYRSGAFTEYFNSEYGIDLITTTDQHLDRYREESPSDTSGIVVALPDTFFD